MEITEIQNLSNEELRQVLVKNGVSVGPVLGTTRRVYEKKLFSILGANSTTSDTPSQLNGSPAPASEDSDALTPARAALKNGHDSLVHRSVTPLIEQRAGTPVLVQNTRSSPMSKAITEDIDEDDYCGEESFRYLPDISGYTTKVKQEQTNAAASFAAVAVLVAFIAFVAVFFFKKETTELIMPYVELGKPYVEIGTEWIKKVIEYVKPTQDQENLSKISDDLI